MDPFSVDVWAFRELLGRVQRLEERLARLDEETDASLGSLRDDVVRLSRAMSEIEELPRTNQAEP